MGRRVKRSWDRHAIAAEVRRKGSNLRTLALEAGLEKSACSAALIRPLPAAEVAISEFLGVTLNELWPDRYPTVPHFESHNTAKQPREASLNGTTDQTAPSEAA